MPMHALFKTLLQKRIKIELKNTLILSGALEDIDTFFNFKITDVKIDENPLEIPLIFTGSVFIRGSSVKAIWIKGTDVDGSKLETATRKTMLYKKLMHSGT